MVVLFGLLVWSCESPYDDFREYEKAVKPVKLGFGTLSRDSVQWNNVYRHGEVCRKSHQIAIIFDIS